MVRIKPAHATTNGTRQSCWSLILMCMSAPQTAGQTEVKRQREEGCLPLPNLKPSHRESNSETTDGGLSYTHMLTHILRRSRSKIHQTGMIHDVWSHRGATNTQDTLHTCVMLEACNHKDPVMHFIFTVKHSVHTFSAYRPSEGTI